MLLHVQTTHEALFEELTQKLEATVLEFADVWKHLYGNMGLYSSKVCYKPALPGTDDLLDARGSLGHV